MGKSGCHRGRDSLRYPSGIAIPRNCGIRQNPLARPRFDTRIVSLSGSGIAEESHAEGGVRS
eukprot:7391361-Prymnesium_polylepis.1